MKISISNLNLEVPKLVDINVDITTHTVIIGPNGAGKTSILKSICGYYPHTGTVTVNDTVITSKNVHEYFSWAWQEDKLDSKKTVMKNVLNQFKPQNIHQYAKILKIDNKLDCLPTELSFGELQRANILKAACSSAPILLLDEPMHGVDPVSIRKTLKQLIFNLQQSGKTVVMISHQIDHVYGLFDDAIVVKAGKIFTSGNLHDIYNNPRSTWLANFFGPYVLLTEDDLNSFEFHEGEEGPWMVRPEWFKINRPSEDRPGNAIVSSMHWNGPSTRVNLELKSTKKPITVDMFFDPRFKIGDDVYVNFKKYSQLSWADDK
jgi:ABC-2 type transport system ATP-binding protein